MLFNNCIILGLDISTKSTGWSICKYVNDSLQLIKYDCITRDGMDIPEVIVNFEQELTKIIQTYKPDFISAESPFVGSNRNTIQKLCYLHGIALLVSRKFHIPITYYSVMTLKSKVLNGVKLKDSNGNRKTGKELKLEVQQEVINYFGKENFSHEYNDDVTDSLSCCITFMKMNGKEIEKKKKSKKKKRME